MYIRMMYSTVATDGMMGCGEGGYAGTYNLPAEILENLATTPPLPPYWHYHRHHILTNRFTAIQLKLPTFYYPVVT